MTRLAGLIASVAIVALGAAVAAAPNLSGRWTVSVQTPHGDISAAMVLKQDGKKVTGTVENPHGGSDHTLAGEFVEGTLDLATTDGDDSGSMIFKAKLKDDVTLAGYLSSQMGDLPFTATRIKN
jgi:hypothetical protein